MTFVEGDTGVIVIDPLISHRDRGGRRSALYRAAPRRPPGHRRHLHPQPRRPLRRRVRRRDPGRRRRRARARSSPRRASSSTRSRRTSTPARRCRRRAGYMYGAALARGPRGQVGAGLGQTTSTGEVGLIVPTLDDHRRRARPTPSTGSRSSSRWRRAPRRPSEMHFYFPRYRALCMAENATHTLHNLLTLRGALVRDPHVWSHVPHRGHRDASATATDVVFASHHWPTWGDERVVDVPRHPARPVRATCTTRRCACSTRATRAPRSPR